MERMKKRSELARMEKWKSWFSAPDPQRSLDYPEPAVAGE
jgi:hypothetical protein